MPEEVFVESKSADWTKVILAAVVGLGLLAGSAYAGYYYGTQQVQQSEESVPTISQPTPKPTPTPEPTTPPVTDSTADWKTYVNNRFKYEFKYPVKATVFDADDFDKGGCVMVKVGFAHLSIKGPGVAAGGCITTGRGALETYEPISENVKVVGQTYIASGDREDSSKNPDAKIRFREFLRIEDLNEINDFMVEYGGSYNSSDVDAYQTEKETIKTILSTFKFLN